MAFLTCLDLQDPFGTRRSRAVRRAAAATPTPSRPAPEHADTARRPDSPGSTAR